MEKIEPFLSWVVVLRKGNDRHFRWILSSSTTQFLRSDLSLCDNVQKNEKKNRLRGSTGANLSRVHRVHFVIDNNHLLPQNRKNCLHISKVTRTQRIENVIFVSRNSAVKDKMHFFTILRNSAINTNITVCSAYHYTLLWLSDLWKLETVV